MQDIERTKTRLVHVSNLLGLASNLLREETFETVGYAGLNDLRTDLIDLVTVIEGTKHHIKRLQDRIFFE